MAGPGSRRYGANTGSGGSSGNDGDVVAFRFNTVNVSRSASSATKLAGFTQWNSLNSEPSDNAHGWVYTDTYANIGVSTPPSGNTRGLVQEFYPISMRPTQAILAATSTNPPVFTVASTATWVTGHQIIFENLPGDFGTNLNDINRDITVINGTTFSVPVNATGYAAYTSGGTVGTSYDSFQPDPYLQWGDETDAEVGDLPANVWIQTWMIVPETFDADIGSGTDTFTSTFATRDKSIYPSREEAPDPIYGASFMDGLNWDFLLGAGGYESINEHLSVPAVVRDEAFLCLDTGGAAFGGGGDNALTSEGDQHKLYQNLNNTTGKIVKGIWTEVRMHFDTSGANGTWEAWIKKEGQARVKVAEWIGGTTPSFTWSIPAPERVGHRVFRLNAVVNGDPGFGDHMLVYDTIDIATSEANLPDYDA